MLPTKSFISTNNNNNITDIITNTTNNNSSSSVSFQAKRKPKMETNNINKPISSTQTTTLSSKQPTVSMNQQQHHHSHHHHHHQQQQNESKLYVLSSIELRENLENTLEESYNKLKHLISPNATNNNSNQQPDNNIFNELSNYSNQSKAQYDEVCNALLYSILTDQSNSSRCLRNLFLCNNLTISFSSSSSVSSSINQSINMSGGLNDPNSNSSSYGVLINNLNSIITENYQRLLDIPRQQLIWLLRELVKARVNQCERLLLQMLRHIQSGSLTEKNYWLAESMLDILTELQTNSTNDSNNSNTSSSSSQFWIYSHNELMTQTLYTYLRIIADHGQAVALTQLRQRETEFCIQILRERWTECMQIGRDLVRLLQNLAKINEFDQLWRDITQSPQVLSPQFAQLGGLSYMMRLPSRRRCLISRLTIEMERKIYFIITSVKAGQQKRYLEWFQRQYLNTPESQSLRVDIIRYICVVVHPTNEQLNSGLTPRWSLCAWLLNTCTNQIELANLKLALFFDWLFYDAKKDNIMLIEPAILLMFNSIRCQNTANPVNNLSSSLTNSLFDFLCRISTNYYWPLRDQILNGIMQSFKDSVEKRVIPSMQVFFANITDTTTNQNSANNNNNNNNNKFNTNNQQSSILLPDLKVLIQNTFGNFFQTLNLNQTPQSPAIVQQPPPASVTPPPSISSQAVSPILKQSNESPSFGSGLSLFKQRPKTELVSDESGISSTEAPSTPSTTPPSSSSLSSSASQPLSFQSYFSFNKTENNETIKTEPTPILLNSNEFTSLAKTEPQAQFSSDEEESQPNQFINRQTFNNNNDNSQSNTLKQASYSGVQKQLHSFTISNRPFKVFTTIDDCNSILNTNSNSLENHLNLIQSDDLRDKLTELNEKLKELNPTNTNQDNYQLTSQSHMSLNSFNYLSSLFKDILNFIHKDQEFLNNFNTSLADLAVSICLILQNDFNNQLLPAQCYATNYNSNNNNNRQKQQNSTSFTDQSNQSLFSPNLNFLNSIIDQSLNQRLIFSLFKELSFTTNQSPSREILVQLLHEIYLKQNRVGYYFLFYIYLISLKSSNSVAQSSLNGSCSNSKSKVETRTLIEIYLEFTKDRRNEIKNEFKLKQKKKYSDDDDDDAESSNEPTDSDTASESEQDDNNNEENESINESSSNGGGGGDDDDDEMLVDDLLDEDDILLGECYMQDIRLCQQDDPYLFCFMIPFILRELHESKKSNYMINNSELCQLISSCIDSKQLKDLISSITSQELVLLKEPKSNQKKSKNKKTTRNSNNTTESTNKKRKRTSDSNNKRNNNKSNCKMLDKKSNKKKGKNKKTSKNNKLITTSHSLADVLEASLVWESIEQIFFWQILIAHDDIEINSLLPLFCKLDSNTHSEANYHLFQLLKTSEPTFDIVKFLINRRIDENMEKALFVHWTRRLNASDIKISQIFCKLLNKSATTNNQNQQTSTLKKIKYNESFTNNKKLTAEQQLEIANQQKANSRSKLQLGRLQSIDMDQIPSLDQVLFCLNKLRLNNECMKFILKENILETLQKVHKKYCDDETKKKYSDLFTLAIDESNENGNNRNDNNNNNEDDENENDDENNESENSSNEDNENSSDSQNDSDSNEQQTSKIKKIKSSPRTTKNSMNKSFNNNKSTTASAKSGNKRTIKTLNSKSKKQKLKNSNSSDSEDNNRPRRNNKDASDSDEGKNSDSESDSSTERKKVNKNSRKKT